jgi:two-component system sensor histidine kinase KdpD
MRARRIAGYLIATVGMAALVLALRPFRDSIDPSSAGWAFLVVVVLSATVGGLGPGILASLVAFACSNYFFVPPYHTFEIAQGEHVVMLFVLLGLSALIAFLLSTARARAEAAEARERELQLQQDLARALVEPAPGDENYRLVLQLIVSRMGFRHAALLASGDEGLEEVVHVGEPQISDVSVHEHVERLPLVVGRRSLGLLLLSGPAEPLTAAERRTLEACTDQLALVMERDRMLLAVVRADQERLRARGD